MFGLLLSLLPRFPPGLLQLALTDLLGTDHNWLKHKNNIDKHRICKDSKVFKIDRILLDCISLVVS